MKNKSPFPNLPDNRIAIFLDIDTERLRQESLRAAGKFPFSAADPVPIANAEYAVKLAILTEELGEVAKEVFELTVYEPETSDPYLKLRAELIQVAAVAWLESIPPQL